MVKGLVIAAALALFMNTVSVPETSAVDKAVADFRSATKCESVSVVVLDHGKVSYYGDKYALYQIGSMTKSFTGLAIEKLINDGQVSGEDSVSKYIPGFTAYYGSSPVDIKINDLLTQKSGFSNSETDYPSATADMSLSEWAKSISGKELKNSPGTEYAYSNVNYNLLGLIIENVSGKPYREYIEIELLKPLGMNSTTVGEPQDKANIRSGSRLGFRRTFRYDIPVREGSIPAGYFYSNAEDIGIWMSAWIDFKEPSMEQVFSHLEKEGDYYAGLERFSDNVIGHSGGTPNYSSRMIFSKNQGIGVCVLTNLNVAASTDSLCNNIFAELTGSSHGKLSCDVWTVFDIIFTSVSAAGIAFILLIPFLKKKGFLIAAGIVNTLLIALILILFPIIFGAGLKDIALFWAPWSFSAGLLILATGVVCIAARYGVVKVNEGRKKTG